ncbi:hypothetical protein D910_11013 [Dendroctonus ponderosae]|uniref:Death-associated protein 1 n=2 Tax=Dendroctonus ponderosae TaxID=77166 RepID=U4UKT6_DENPD|nr:hypothetical protein D910_11013 [Dendroctonus ponderosae]
MSSPKEECVLKAGHPPAVILMSSPKEECVLKAGHPPAVRAGGMRITQHKVRRDSGGLTEDTTGITISGSPPKTMTISGAVAKGNADFPVEAVEGFHKEKPPAVHTSKPGSHIIQQPRK